MNFDSLVNKIKAERSALHNVPSFDPQNGNDNAKFLFLFEAPGAKAVKTGIISFNNPDPTARNFSNQLNLAGILPKDIAIWNIVPWYIGNELGTVIRTANGNDIQEGIAYLEPLISAMPNLRCIVLAGGAARKAHVFLSRITEARIVSCHHTSAKVMNANPQAAEENVEVFRFINRTTEAI